MKEIKAIIHPFKLLDVVTELHKIEGLPGVFISDIRGFGKTKEEETKLNPENELVDYVHLVKLEVVVQNEMVEQIVNIIQEKAHTGNVGDGKIFVSTIEKIIKISTNERDINAV